MTVQELQQQYAIGTITYEEYENKINEIRNNVSCVTKHNNSWYYIFGVGSLVILYLYLRKK